MSPTHHSPPWSHHWTSGGLHLGLGDLPGLVSSLQLLGLAASGSSFSSLCVSRGPSLLPLHKAISTSVATVMGKLMKTRLSPDFQNRLSRHLLINPHL